MLALVVLSCIWRDFLPRLIYAGHDYISTVYNNVFIEESYFYYNKYFLYPQPFYSM
jgi:hypothetical protein